ncbi:MAG: GTP-binding protein [Halobacteriovoraceae bacterium]|nr:GTP-binding protein [Halobacteriovoraceae bacterium]MBT5094514.1 GTP-binding protein [Halobacteriovoraceae bacterium]
MHYDDQPIIACSTGGSQSAAIHLVRLSGFSDLLSLQAAFSGPLEKCRPRTVFLSDIVEQKQVLDQAMLIYFEGPNSYTGENVLELNLHGNPLIVERVMELFTSQFGFRHAKEGEFTYRALTNGKMQLSQVEGLDLVLNANSELILNQGFKSLHGELYLKFTELYRYFIKLKATVEMQIDFAEDMGQEQAQILMDEALGKFENLLEELYLKSRGPLVDLATPEVVIYGPTNAGKSSLFNQLLKNERAIVSPEAGTTRDYVSENLHYKKNRYSLTDTAGIRQTSNAIEGQGIKRSRKLWDRAFYKLLVLNPFEENRDWMATEGIDFLVLSHKDRPEFAQKAAIYLENYSDIGILAVDLKNPGSIGPELLNAPIEPLLEKSLGQQTPELDSQVLDITYILDGVTSKFNKLAGENAIIVPRHKEALAVTWESFKRFQRLSLESYDIAILSNEINSLGINLQELIGIISADEVLDDLFSNFCIGK